YINKAAEIQNRRSNKELLGNRYMDMWPGVESTELFAKLKCCMDERIPQEMENFFVFPGKTSGWYDLKITPVPEGIFILSLDITERKKAEETLRKKQGELQTIIDSSQGLVFYKDRTNHFIRVNKAFAEIMGLPKEQLEGRSLFDLYPKEEAEAYWSDDKQVIASGKAKIGIEEKMQSKQGQRWVQTDKIPYQDAEGNIIGVIGFSVDITERKKAEEALQESEQRWATTLASIGDAVIATDTSGKIMFLNGEAEKLTGWKLSEASQKSVKEVFNIVNEQTRLEVENPIIKVLKEGNVCGLENHTVLIRKDGLEVPIDDSGAPIKDKEGKTTGVVLVFRDISKRRQADQEHERLSAIVESTDDAIIGKTLDGIITSWNPAAEKLYGYTANEIIGKSISLLIPPDRKREFDQILERVRRDAKIEHHDTARLRKDGSRLDVDVTVAPIKNSYGEIVGASTIARDITERKKAEDALKKINDELEERVQQRTVQVSMERQRLYNVLETLPSYVILLDRDYHVAFANKVFRETFGEDHGRRCYEYLFNKDHECEGCETYKVYKENKPQHWYWTGPNGHDYDIYDYPFKEADGSTLILEMGIDITERKKAEATVQQERKRFFDVLETLPAMICLITPDYKIAFANRSFREKFGESHGRPCYDYCWGQTEPCTFCESLIPLKTGQPHHWEVKGPDGSIIEAHDYPFTDIDGSKLVLEMDIDVTARKRAEAQAVESARKLKDAERLAAIGATAGMVGHDIRNPLQAITSDVFLAKTELASIPNSEEKKNALESMDEIEKNIDYINKIVQDLQDYARPLNPKIEESDLRSTVEAFIAKNGLPKNITLKVKIADEARRIRVDSYYLNRILFNLVTNAVQAMPDGGKLTIDAHKEAGDTVLSVKDTGFGIPLEIQDKMFTLMFTTKSKGQGFGLPVVKRMAESLGGKVTFMSEEGKGTTFIIRLPQKS
ncbi:MAG TPA: PAS domain S-box protein, partial [Candidatus Nanoarchaeia archaeon]|nr:PAS domain S-box protein [Candidatus Nanoarchaeia archaeon]